MPDVRTNEETTLCALAQERIQGKREKLFWLYQLAVTEAVECEPARPGEEGREVNPGRATIASERKRASQGRDGHAFISLRASGVVGFRVFSTVGALARSLAHSDGEGGERAAWQKIEKKNRVEVL